jgi:ATP-dependent DNA helicase RecQ
MMLYAQTGYCRWRTLLEYFGDRPTWERCGNCDNCLRPPETQLAPLPERKRPRPPRNQHASPLSPGDAVRVPRFGNGEVTAVEGDAVTIRLHEGGTRTFVRDYVRRL